MANLDQDAVNKVFKNACQSGFDRADQEIAKLKTKEDFQRHFKCDTDLQQKKDGTWEPTPNARGMIRMMSAWFSAGLE